MPEPEITMKNTKQEILDALSHALKRAEAAEKMRLNPEKVEKERNEKRVVEATKKAVEQNIFSKELNEKFGDLQEAIAAEENRLQELYGLGKEVRKLALAIEAGRERITAIETERAEKEAAAKTSMERLKKEFEQKNAELQAEYNAHMNKVKVERTRENEEYQYTLARKRERENNVWADEKAAREAELQKRESRAAEMLAEAESKAGFIQTLEEKVESIPSILLSEKENAVAAATETLKREYGHQTALAEMERKNAVVRLEDKVAFLEKQLTASNKAVDALQAKLDKAYSEMRDLAAKTVETTGSLKIINNTDKNS